MDRLRATFETQIGLPWATLRLPEAALVPVSGDAESTLLWGTQAAADRPFLTQGEAFSFAELAPDGYFLVGFWGHGVNSYAFYYAVADSWRRVLLRLPYGGVYMDNDEMARDVRAFLLGYFEFEDNVRERGYRLTAIDSMDAGLYRFTCPDGSRVERHDSLFGTADFASLLVDLTTRRTAP